MISTLGTLEVVPALTRLDLLAPSTAEAIASLPLKDEIGVSEIDPSFSDTAAFCEHYKISLEQTVNCVILKASRGDKISYAACMIFGNTRADVNGLARRQLGARKASFAPTEEAVALTKMEYGGITPVGLPQDWPILIDKRVADAAEVVIGSGIRKSKLILTGKVLVSLPNAVVLEGLGK